VESPPVSRPIFISYAVEDRERIVPLVRALEEEGWKVWWDRSGIRSGQRFGAVIEQALDDAACVVVAWSADSRHSKWVEAEAHTADEDDKLVPIFLEPVRPPLFFRRVHTEDLSNWSGDRAAPAYGRLVEAIAQFVPRLKKPKPEGGGATPDRGPEASDVGTPALSAEQKTLLDRIADRGTPPEERFEIGDRLARLGDPRPGVGLTSEGLPDVDWVQIPAGPYLYGKDTQKRELPTFHMARYPVTNAQYRAFIEDGGYAQGRWWDGLGKRIKRPMDPPWGEPNRSRDTVSWYEAAAFCGWLSARLGYEVRLPSEYEWEKAARGTDGRVYPWGDAYQAGHANVDEKSSKAGPTYLGQTVAVGLYPQGASPYGAQEMAGNLWEWCLNEYENEYEHPDRAETSGQGLRALRGGSWGGNPEVARVFVRLRYVPVYRRDFVGFRLCCSSPMPR